MITYINILFLTIMTTCTTSCDKISVELSEEFFFGAWNQTDASQQTIAFFYAQGVEFNKDGTASPRFDYDKDGIYNTNDDYIGQWAYEDAEQKISFTENKDQSPVFYLVDTISDNKIKLINPNTKEEYLFQRE